MPDSRIGATTSGFPSRSSQGIAANSAVHCGSSTPLSTGNPMLAAFELTRERVLLNWPPAMIALTSINVCSGRRWVP